MCAGERNDPDGHQAILFRFAHKLAGAAGHTSPVAEPQGSGGSIPHTKRAGALLRPHK